MLSRLLGSVVLVASVPVIAAPVACVVTVAVVPVTISSIAAVGQDCDLKRAFEAVSERHVDGMVGDRRRQREREAGLDRVARPLDGAAVVVTLTIVIAAAVLAPAGVYRAADAASLGCCKPARLIQLHNVCGTVLAESDIDDRCEGWCLNECAPVVVSPTTHMAGVRFNPPHTREARRRWEAG